VAVKDEDKKKFKIRKSEPTFRWYLDGKAKHAYKEGDTFQDIVVFVMDMTNMLARDLDCDKIKNVS